MVEHSAVNRVVVGSSPTRGADEKFSDEGLRTFFDTYLQNHILNYRISTTTYFIPQLSDSFIKPDGFIHVIGFAND